MQIAQTQSETIGISRLDMVGDDGAACVEEDGKGTASSVAFRLLKMLRDLVSKPVPLWLRIMRCGIEEVIILMLCAMEKFGSCALVDMHKGKVGYSLFCGGDNVEDKVK